MACEFCTAAQTDPNVGRVDTRCRGCRVRYASNQPRPRREQIIDAIADDEERDHFRAEVIEEYQRRRRLRTN